MEFRRSPLAIPQLSLFALPGESPLKQSRKTTIRIQEDAIKRAFPWAGGSCLQPPQNKTVQGVFGHHHAQPTNGSHNEVYESQRAFLLPDISNRGFTERAQFPLGAVGRRPGESLEAAMPVTLGTTKLLAAALRIILDLDVP
jgi:hypothetical protein